MSRETLSCDEWHYANPLVCKEAYGFPTFRQLKVFLGRMFEEFSKGGKEMFEAASTTRGRTDIDAISEFDIYIDVKLFLSRILYLQTYSRFHLSLYAHSCMYMRRNMRFILVCTGR